MRSLAAALACILLLNACGLNEMGPWLDGNGNRMSGNDMVEFRGFALCDQQEVVFIQLFGDQYAKDPERVLGDLTSPDTGDSLSFEVLEAPPPSAEATGITHDGREIYLSDDRSDYLYVRLPNGQAERWPRAESTCDRDESL